MGREAAVRLETESHQENPVQEEETLERMIPDGMAESNRLEEILVKVE